MLYFGGTAMRVAEFVKALQELPQDAEITFTVGYGDEDREMYALGVLDSDLPAPISCCLDGMLPGKITADCYVEDKESFVEVFLDADLDIEYMNMLDKYHKDYIKKRDGEQPKEA